MPEPGRAAVQFRTSGALCALLATFAGTLVALAARPSSAAAVTRTTAIQSAAAYATAQGYHVGIAVLDTETGRTYRAGDYKGTFATESVAKVFIATRLLVEGRMSGSIAQMAYKMITQSDDAMANALYGLVGGDQLINWIKAYFELPGLGSPPSRPGWWGNTKVTPTGLVRFYNKIKHNKQVAPWLLNAMHHATTYGSDGTYQFFGLPSAASSFGVKQGWGDDYDDWSASADFNTTGFVDGDRYAVAILARGPAGDYGWPISKMLTHTARLLLPNGHFPDPVPTLTRLSRNSGPTTGGRRVWVYGSSFTDVRRVMFGAARGTGLRVSSRHALSVLAPPHAAGVVNVRVVTSHGGTPRTTADRFRFVAAPVVVAVQPQWSGTAGGTQITVTGMRFLQVQRVVIGGAMATGVHVASAGKLTAVTPAHPAGRVFVRVVTAYGRSALSHANRFLFDDGQPPVTDIRASRSPDQTVQLTWTDPQNRTFAGVKICRSTVGAAQTSGCVAVGRVPAPGTAFEDSALAPEATYYYTLFAYDAFGVYSSGATVVVTP